MILSHLPRFILLRYLLTGDNLPPHPLTLCQRGRHWTVEDLVLLVFPKTRMLEITEVWVR